MAEIQESVRRTTPMLCYLVVVLILQFNCMFRSSETKTINSGGLPVSETVQDADTVDLTFREKPNVINAWRNFNKNDRYRMASFKDFKFSRAAISRMSGYDSLWQQKLDSPYIFGDITRLGRSTDLAMIVVDKDPEHPQQRFGLIVFNALSDKTYSDPKLVFRDTKLATSTLGWAGNLPTVFSYAEDGSIEKLYINWSPRSETYSLDEKQIRIGAKDSERP